MRRTTFVVLLLVAALSGYAQTSTSGSITGTVVDSQHATVPNATVTAKEQQQQFTYTTKSDESGHFFFAQVPPGTYTVQVQAPGFKKYERVNITLNANDKLGLGDL